jgi:hypothetical protein
MRMSRKIVAAALAGVFVCLSFLANLASESQFAAGDSSFPMREGTVWVYRGVVRSRDMQLQKDVSSVVSVKSEIVRVFRGEGFVAALVRGFPADFDWSDCKTDPRDYLFVQTRGGDFHVLTSEEKLAENIKKLETPDASVQDMFSDDDLFMKFPLRKGMKFCDPEAMKRTDDHYCWVVASVHEVQLNDVKGLKPGKQTAFLLQYLTNPDDTELEFVPGLGFISYRYHHHGTVADTEMRLVEYRAAGDTQTMPGAPR